ncbi:MAG: hypothetical protein IJ019_04460 [Alphaproteobacteria bacterium]|nr:hypothetical protein [Alphaproteobacteria bacterium]
MKKFIALTFIIFFVSGFSSLSSMGQSLEVVSESHDWEVMMLSNDTIKAYNPSSKLELLINLSNLLPSSPYCVSNKRIKDIKFSISIHKIANKGESNWVKSFEKTKIYFSGNGNFEERKVYGSNLIKNNIKASGGVINVGTLEFLSPITCDDINNTTLRILGMKNIPLLSFNIKLKK